LARKLNIEIIRPDFHDTAFVCLHPRQAPIGHVLLSYIIDPFLLKPGEKVDNSHHNHWLSLQIANTFLEFGFSVDVISFLNKTYVPAKEYAYFVGTRINFQRIAEYLHPDCVKILHLTTAHWLFNNSCSMQRTLDIQRRRGVTLQLRKQVEENWAIEHADFCTTNWGNGFNVGTYAYADKPIFQIPLPTCSTHGWPEGKDFDKCRRNFMWFGSGGLAHKGLDLVLEAFAAMPDCHLWVCGPVNKEKDFERAFEYELYKCPNIHTVGWVDVESQRFLDLAYNCVGVVFTSCAEGGGASVVTCMQVGLIPIVSFESCVEVKDFGISLDHASISSIQVGVSTLAALPEAELIRRARVTWEFTRSHHSREIYAGNYRQVIETIMAQGRRTDTKGAVE
jgi:glycosyltransferase involved in cell wall biosynthesis